MSFQVIFETKNVIVDKHFGLIRLRFSNRKQTVNNGLTHTSIRLSYCRCRSSWY